MASSKPSLQTKDFISNVPDIVTDKILELLPIRMAARTSALSKQWRCNWLSMKRLTFDYNFCLLHLDEKKKLNWQLCCETISSILFHHNGPVHDFHLDIIHNDTNEKCMNMVSQWLSFLSKNEVRRIKIMNRLNDMPISSYIFRCNELVELELLAFALNPPPTGFNGFPKLKHLKLFKIKFTQEDIFCSIMAKCRMLATLKLFDCSGMDHINIDVPSLEALTITGQFESLDFGDVRNLKSISVSLLEMKGKQPVTAETVDTINLLAGSCQLQSIKFGGELCKFLAGGGISKHLSASFNHLKRLCLNDLDLGDSRVLPFVFDIVERSPYIKEIEISVKPSKNATQLNINCNNNHKMNHLVEVKITGVTGSSAELKLMEYLLAVSVVLEKLVYRCGKRDTESQLKLSTALLGFPRASTRARVVSLKPYY